MSTLPYLGVAVPLGRSARYHLCAALGPGVDALAGGLVLEDAAALGRQDDVDPAVRVNLEVTWHACIGVVWR